MTKPSRLSDLLHAYYSHEHGQALESRKEAQELLTAMEGNRYLLAPWDWPNKPAYLLNSPTRNEPNNTERFIEFVSTDTAAAILQSGRVVRVERESGAGRRGWHELQLEGTEGLIFTLK